MNHTLEVNKLCKDYGDFRLRDISFTLPTGYIMGLIGPNGAGKTTIIKSIMNLVMMDSGDIRLFGKDHRQDEVDIKQKIGFVYDTPNYYDHLNLKELKRIIAPFYEKWDDNVFNKLVNQFDLPLNKAINKFSKGMSMKASIVLALSHHAEFIIMDEPTSGLDPVVRRELLEFFRELLATENTSILFSSHVTSDIEQVADYITFVSEGQMVFSESKDDIFEKYAMVKGGTHLLKPDIENHFVNVRSGAYGFEALTKDVADTKKLFGDQVIYDRLTLEDIMYFSNMKNRSASNTQKI